ncbi:MAG TPA: hypothetical protein VMZ52_08005 [Bryobacteraceae bacterium]|nr:hypothetical protein [Bryobacteraceae bacterium]
MLRGLVYLLCTIFIISLVRGIIGIILKGFGELVSPAGVPRPASAGAGTPVGGELKKDPVCGTYVSALSSVKKTAGGQIVHFCSAACRDKYAG